MNAVARSEHLERMSELEIEFEEWAIKGYKQFFITDDAPKMPDEDSVDFNQDFANCGFLLLEIETESIGIDMADEGYSSEEIKFRLEGVLDDRVGFFISEDLISALHSVFANSNLFHYFEESPSFTNQYRYYNSPLQEVW